MDEIDDLVQQRFVDGGEVREVDLGQGAQGVIVGEGNLAAADAEHPAQDVGVLDRAGGVDGQLALICS